MKADEKDAQIQSPIPLRVQAITKHQSPVWHLHRRIGVRSAMFCVALAPCVCSHATSVPRKIETFTVSTAPVACAPVAATVGGTSAGALASTWVFTEGGRAAGADFKRKNRGGCLRYGHLPREPSSHLQHSRVRQTYTCWHLAALLRKRAHLEPVLFLRLLPELELVCLSRFSTATSVLAPQESAYKALAMVALFVSMLAPSVEQPKTSHAVANP